MAAPEPEPVEPPGSYSFDDAEPGGLPDPGEPADYMGYEIEPGRAARDDAARTQEAAAGTRAATEAATEAAPDPDRISAEADAGLPDLEQLLHQVHAEALSDDLVSTIGVLAGTDGLWFAQWQGNGFDRAEAFRLACIMVRERFRT